MANIIDFNITKEQFDETRQNAVNAFNFLCKKETNGKFSILDTMYAVLADMKKKCKYSLLLKCEINIVAYCQWHDEYYKAYYEQNPDVKRTEPMLRKPIQKSCFPRLKKNTHNVKNFSVRFSKAKFTESDLLMLRSLYPQARNNAEAVKMLFTETEFIAYNSEMNTYISSLGGKKNAMPYFNLGILGNQSTAEPLNKAIPVSADISAIKCTTSVEAFARTMAITLNNFYLFDHFYCGEADYRFVNYMNVIAKWFDKMIESIKIQFKGLADTFNHKKFRVEKIRKCANLNWIKKHIKKDKKGKIITPKIRQYYWRGKDTNKVYKNLLNISHDVKSTSCEETKISAAAALYIVINVSFSGNEKNAVSILMDCFTKQLNKRVHDLKYLSTNMPKIKYVKSDFRETIKKFLNDPSALLILDPPYLKEFGLPCGDYNDPFTYNDMLDMFKLLENAKCKVILFHSRNYWLDSTAVSYGLHKVGYYVSRNIGKEYKPYYTEIYSKNIDSSVKFFDPKNHGELYTDNSLNTQPDSSISSEKGVL